jgi:hypothetical protein
VNAGTYNARAVEGAVYESEKSGSLVLRMDWLVETGERIKSYHQLAAKDGTPNVKGIERIREWSGWDGGDPFWFTDSDLASVLVELVIELEPGMTNPAKMYPKVAFVNRPGGGGREKPAPVSDRAAILAKYGAKLRAVAGPVAVAAPPKVAPPAPATPANSDEIPF